MDYGTESLLTGLFLMYLLLFFGLGIGYLVSYILRGVGMYTLGKRRGMSYPWLAFVPYARTYFQGELCGTIRLGKRELKTPGLWLLVIPFAVSIVMGVFAVFIWGGVAMEIARLSMSLSPSQEYYMEAPTLGTGWLLLVIGMLAVTFLSLVSGAIVGTLQVLVNHQIYARYTDRNLAMVHAVMGLFLPLYTSIYFFVIRNREKGLGYPGPGAWNPGPQAGGPQTADGEREVSFGENE